MLIPILRDCQNLVKGQHKSTQLHGHGTRHASPLPAANSVLYKLTHPRWRDGPPLAARSFFATALALVDLRLHHENTISG